MSCSDGIFLMKRKADYLHLCWEQWKGKLISSQSIHPWGRGRGYGHGSSMKTKHSISIFRTLRFFFFHLNASLHPSPTLQRLPPHPAISPEYTNPPPSACWSPICSGSSQTSGASTPTDITCVRTGSAAALRAGRRAGSIFINSSQQVSHCSKRNTECYELKALGVFGASFA